MHNIKYFVKNEFILLLIIFIVLINPFFYGSRLGLLFFVFVVSKPDKFLPIFDRNVFYIFTFSLTYGILSSLRVDNSRQEGILAIISDVIVPFSIYLVGKYLSSKYKDIQIYLFILFFIGFSFSLIPIISILDQIFLSGFLEGARNMYLIWDKNTVISATALGSCFLFNMSSIGLIIVKKNTKFELRLTLANIILFVLSMVCILRLGSRTQILLSLVSIFVAFILNIKRQSLFNIFIKFLSFSSIFFYLYSNTNQDSEIFQFYADRIGNGNGYGIDDAGGRSNRWIGALQSIITDPFGWEFERFGHAHNLWLDVARVSGIIPLFFLLFFTFSAFKNWIRVVSYFKNELFIKTYISILFLLFILQFSVEPVIEGMYLLFLSFCLFVGFIKGIKI